MINIVYLCCHRCYWPKREHPEKWYQEKWCRQQGGQIEVVLPDKTRCDCVTDTHAIEFDFGNGWAEAIGQSYSGFPSSVGITSNITASI
jgi:hypothetical protein